MVMKANTVKEAPQSDFWDWQGPHHFIETNERGGSIHVYRARKKGALYTVVQKFYIDASGAEQPGKGCTIPDDVAAEVANLILEAESDTENKKK